jgi:hypothetical protein
MIDVRQLRSQLIAPVLEHLGMYSPAAEALLVGTALQESRGGTYLRQLGGGPALGIYQMEPATHDDIWENFLAYKPQLKAKVEALLAPAPSRTDQLATNLAYATAMCRIHYYRCSDPLPPANQVRQLAEYWKQHYNTPLGAGTVAEFEANYGRALA